MNILLIGGLSDLGKAIINELNSRNHKITILDSKSKNNKKSARELKKNTVKIIFGELKNNEYLINTIGETQCIIHIREVNPLICEKDVDLSLRENAGGIKNIIETIEGGHHDIPLIFVSTAAVMGNTQLQNQPVNTRQNPMPATMYAKSKLMAEECLENSDVKYCILRLTSVIYTKSEISDEYLKGLFDFPLDAKNEFLLDIDAASAIVNASENISSGDNINKKVYFVGGGYQNGFQLTNKIYIDSLFEALGIGTISENCFIKYNPLYSMNWFDTEESNKILSYQNNSFAWYLESVRNKTRSGGLIVEKLAPKLKKIIEKQSPYLEQNLKEN